MASPRSVTAVLGALRAEAVLGLRLTVRHPVPRAAFGWAVGLAALTRLLGGAPPPPDVAAGTIAFAGLFAAVAGPRGFVRGGPLESSRWGALAPGLAAIGRLGGALVVAGLGSMAAGFALGGTTAWAPQVLAGAALHAAVIGALGAGLAPAWGCTTATVLPVLLVAAGVAPPGPSSGFVAAPAAVPLPPPGLLVMDVLAGQEHWDTGRLAAWVGLACLSVAGLGWRAARVPEGRGRSAA